MRRGRPLRVPALALLAWAALAIPAAMPQADDGDPRRFHVGDDDDEEAQGPHFHSEEEMGGHAERSEVPEVWLAKGEITRPHLLEVQALIVKDEQVAEDCKPSDEDLRKSNWRHFMCYGSILSNTFILTTASCLHEALYIRHNIEATLAAVIGPVSESIQVIKMLQYIIHPKLDVDPRHTRDHIKHDVAVAKLACKISKKNFFPIELPIKPLREMCNDDKCFVTVIKRQEDHSNLIFEYVARDIEYHKLNVRQASAEDTKVPITFAGNTKENDNLKQATESRLMCTKTGSAVMKNKTQAGMVSMSCDVRQPETPWLYTDLYDNVDWIVSVADLQRPTGYSNHNAEDKNGKCSTCVYNFYFDWKQTDICPNKVINDLRDSLTTCKGNSAGQNSKENSSEINAYPRDDYLRALDVMYRDQFKHNHEGVPIAPPKNTVSSNDQMIPVTSNFEVSRKTDTNKNDVKQNADSPKPKENKNQKSTKLPNKIGDKVEPRKNDDVPEEYKNLYDQYLQELQLKNI